MATKRKAELAAMTWKEAAEAYADNPVILLPMGSIEQHGPQTPVGDYRYTTEMSKRIASQTGAISAPTIPWGYSDNFKEFPGCITLQPETLKQILYDNLDGFLRHGLDHIVFVIGHKGNVPIVEQVARKIKETHGIRLAAIEPLSWLTRDFLEEAYGTKDFKSGHGSDPMTSLGMYINPDDVRLDLAEVDHPHEFAGLGMQGMSTVNFDGYPVFLYCDTHEVTPNGVLGTATPLASKEVGERAVNHMVEIGSKFVEWFAKQSTRVNP